MTTPIRERWQAGESTFGAWLSLPSTVMAEVTARSGFDYVCIDTQHGAIEYSDSVAMIQAILLGGSSPIVRVPWNEQGEIGKMLDAGAHGVIVPMVNSVAEAETVVKSVRYAPSGARSYGPTVAGMRVDTYPEWSAENVATIPMIETRQAVDDIDAILAVPGIDAVYVGPADLSITLGLAPGNNDGEASFDDALATIVAACKKAGVVAGIHATGALAQKRLAAGFEMVTVAADLLAARLGYKTELDLARSSDPGADDEGGVGY